MRTAKKGPVCLVCLKVFENKGNDCDRTSYQKRALSPSFQNSGLHIKTENEEATEVEDSSSNLYLRFLNFTRKYLGLESSGSELVRGAKAKFLETGKDVRAFCELCQKKVSRICDLYTEFQTVQLQLLWRLDQLGDTLTDMPYSRRKRFSILRTQMNVDKTALATLVPHFRTQLKIRCKLKAKKNCGPFVSLPRGLDPEEWKFTHAATKETLMRLIVVYALGSDSSNVSAEEEPTSVEAHTDSSNLIPNPSSLEQPEACVNDDDVKIVENCGIETNILVKKESESEPSLAYDACGDEFADFADSAPPSPEVDNDTDDEWAPNAVTAGSDLENSQQLNLKRRRSQRINTGTMEDECMKEERVETEDVLKSDDKGGSKEDESEEIRGPKRPGRKRGHLLPKLLVCPYEDCRKSFAIQRCYAFHLLTIHKRKISCSECGLKFKQLTELTRHMKTVHRKSKKVPWFLRKGSGKRRQKVKSLSKEKVEKELSKEEDGKEKKKRKRGRPTLKSLSKEKDEKREKKIGRPRFASLSKEKYEKEVEKSTKRVLFYSCDVCGKCFRQVCDRSEHMTSEHNDCYPCLQSECKASFLTGKELREHLESTHELKHVEKFHCDTCLRGFTCQQYRDIHAKTVHDKNRFFCDKIGCVEECNSNTDLLEHIKSHLIPPPEIKTEETDEKEGHVIFHCLECKRPFFYEHNMTFHKLMHTPLSLVNESGYDCPSCDFNAYYRKSLIQHYAKNHSSHLKIYRCKYDKCNKSFTRERAYLEHKARCLFQTDVLCALCGKHFKDTRNLYCHTRAVHTGIKQKRIRVYTPLKCNQPDCDYTVYKIDRLHRHLFRKHGIGEAILCQVCGATFPSRGDVDRHVKLVHEERKYECPICHKKFPKKHTWEWHKENAHNPDQRPYVCQICGKSYRNTSGLRYHIGDKHTDEKKFSCENCGKKYFRKDVFKLHEKNCKKRVVQEDGPDVSTSSSNEVQGEANN